MPTLTVETVRTDSVTFVEAVIEAERPCNVRLETRIDGPVWPPRTDGTVVDRWDVDGVTVEAKIGKTAVGFSTPVATAERPIEIVRTEPLERDGTVADEWVERIERRLETAESIAAAGDVPAATDAVAAVGGFGEVERLAGEIARDRRIAAELSVVPARLCERLEAVEIPTDSFAALAEAET